MLQILPPPHHYAPTAVIPEGALHSLARCLLLRHFDTTISVIPVKTGIHLHLYYAPSCNFRVGDKPPRYELFIPSCPAPTIVIEQECVNWHEEFHHNCYIWATKPSYAGSMPCGAKYSTHSK